MHDFKNMSDKELSNSLRQCWVPCHACNEWMEVPGHFYCWYHEKHVSECDCPPIEKWIEVSACVPFDLPQMGMTNGLLIGGGPVLSDEHRDYEGERLKEFMTEKDIAFWDTATDELKDVVLNMLGESVYAALSAMRLSASYQEANP